MRFLIYGLAALVAVVIVIAAFIRFAPTDPAVWNAPITVSEDVDFEGGTIRVLAADEEMFARVDSAMRELARTRVMTGSLQEQRITYVTRSALWGFPDYTTVQFNDGVLKLYGRLRFGRSDLGVNGERLQRVLRRAKGG